MSSKESDLLDVELGVPTTPRDVEALRRLRAPRLTFDEYLRFLSRRPAPTADELRKRKGPRGEPFRL